MEKKLYDDNVISFGDKTAEDMVPVKKSPTQIKVSFKLNQPF